MKKQCLFYFIFSFVASLPVLNASSQLKYTLTGKSSTLMEAKQISGEIRLSAEDASPVNLSQVNFICPVENINSPIAPGGLPTGNLRPQLTGYTNGEFAEDNSLMLNTFVKYNTITNDQPSNPSVSRVELGGGWFITKDIGTKLVYKDQNNNNFAT